MILKYAFKFKSLLFSHLRLLLSNDLLHDFAIKLFRIQIVLKSHSVVLTQSVGCKICLLVLYICCRDSTTSPCYKTLLYKPHKCQEFSFIQFSILVFVSLLKISRSFSINFSFEFWVLFLFDNMLLMSFANCITQCRSFLKVSHQNWHKDIELFLGWLVLALLLKEILLIFGSLSLLIIHNCLHSRLDLSVFRINNEAFLVSFLSFYQIAHTMKRHCFPKMTFAPNWLQIDTHFSVL